MAKKRFVHVTVNGATYAPDDDMPGDVEKSIDNDKVFANPDAKSTK